MGREDRGGERGKKGGRAVELLNGAALGGILARICINVGS
jgi:hypothetical protein